MNNAEAGQTGDLTPEELQEAAVIVAQRNAMARGARNLQHGTRLFTVEQGWESKVIAADKSVAVADTLLTLEAALRAPEPKVIFIPHDALMTDGDIEKLCQRNGTVKTLFKEVKKS